MLNELFQNIFVEKVYNKICDRGFIYHFAGTGEFDLDGIFLLIFTQIGILGAVLAFAELVEKFIIIYKSILQLNNYGVPEDYDQFNKELNFHSKLSFWYSIITVYGAILSPILEYNACMKKKKSHYDICGVLNTWAPFDITIFPYKQITYLAQTYNFTFTYLPVLSLSFFSAMFGRFLLYRLKYVRKLLSETNGNLSYGERKMKLFKAIAYHQELLR